MKSKILQKLETIALNRTTPFCYGCYIKVHQSTCPNCHSDDLMRHFDGVGVEWGTSWVIKYILQDELTAINIDDIFEESIRHCYPEYTTVGWMNLDTVDLMKSQDSISWNIARDEYIDSLEQDEEIISFDDGATYFWIHEIENLKD
jgi:hypothetical protein